MDVRWGQRDDERVALGVDHKMAFAPRLAFIRWILADDIAPLFAATLELSRATRDQSISPPKRALAGAPDATPAKRRVSSTCESGASRWSHSRAPHLQREELPRQARAEDKQDARQHGAVGHALAAAPAPGRAHARQQGLHASPEFIRH